MRNVITLSFYWLFKSTAGSHVPHWQSFNATSCWSLHSQGSQAECLTDAFPEKTQLGVHPTSAAHKSRLQSLSVTYNWSHAKIQSSCFRWLIRAWMHDTGWRLMRRERHQTKHFNLEMKINQGMKINVIWKGYFNHMITPAR